MTHEQNQIRMQVDYVNELAIRTKDMSVVNVKKRVEKKIDPGFRNAIAKYIKQPKEEK